MPLLVMAVAFTLLFVTLHLAAMRNEILRRRVRTHAADAGASAHGKLARMNLGPHADFIVAAYARGRASSSALLIAWVVLDYRAQRRTLADLEARGVTRRSRARPATTAA